MLHRRRIFRPAPSYRPWGRIALGASALALALALGSLAVPANLLGSALREQQWTASADSILVMDGDTLRLGERTLRLAGLVSPQRGETCSTAQGVGFDCGAAAAEALARLVRGRDIACRIRGQDRFGHALGACQAGEMNTNAALVATGWALASSEAVELVAEEARARQAGRGLWSHLPGAPESWQSRF